MKNVIAELIWKFILLTGILLAYFIFIWGNSNCSEYGDENIQLFAALPFLITLITTITLILHSFWRWSKHSWFDTLLSLIPAIVPFQILMTLNMNFLNKENYYEPFNKRKWTQNTTVKMARTIISTHLLKGKTKHEIKNLLGNKKITAEYDFSFAYYLSSDKFLILEFDSNQIIREYSISCID